MEDIPGEVKKQIKFVFASEVEDVLKVAMKKWPPTKSQPKRVPPTYPFVVA